MKQIIEQLIQNATKQFIDAIPSSPDRDVNILVDTSHYKYYGHKGQNKDLLIVLNSGNYTDMKMSKDFFSFKKSLNEKVRVFKVPYESVVGLYVPEVNFIIEKDREVLYKVLSIKKKINKVQKEISCTEAKQRPTKIIHIHNYQEGE